MSFYGVTDLWTYVLGAIGIVLLPGPNSLFVLSVATARGVRVGYHAACGVFLGDSILLLFTALGAASLLRGYPALFMVVKYVGAAYLFWVGMNLAWSAWRKWRAAGIATQLVEPTALAAAQSAHLLAPFQRALVISLLNPKAILFLLSFFVQFIDPAYDTPAIPFLILSVIVMAFSAVYLSVLIVAGARLADAFRQRRRTSAGLSGAVGALFLWFGTKLATASLN
ncbi:leucine efflux protein LeuE [Hylemonella gracilis]|uniref:Leucine export protein LeuE n=1 Tax=Hylemonella gracilis ATCC 19624 TaxID=887062 RepID=F3KVR3_9BURK|nr:leucine efflux protein LeuE [Hylemonella gracilis]EGI76129.1 leucine export protein LeuE [Hylemonella gracilis ATCC 19624]